MRSFIQLLLIYTSLLVVNSNSLAQAPDWNVNSASYSNSMSVIGYLWFDKVESTDSGDIVAAFIDGELRGVTSPVFQAEVNRHVIFLTLFSNDASGEVTFKAYDKSADRVVDILATVDFSPDDLVGGLESYFIWSDVALNDKAELLDYSVPGQFNDLPITDNKVDISVNLETDISSLAGSFELSEGAIATIGGVVQESGVSLNDYSQSVTLSVQSENGLVIEEYSINVTVGNETPTDFALSSSEFTENNESGLKVGIFTVKDDEENHSYQFALGEGDSHNHLFKIEGDALMAKGSFNFEEGSQFSIRVKVVDSGANSVEASFGISILDENDAPTVTSQLNSQIINEDVPYKFVLDPANFQDEDDGDSLTLTAADLPNWLSFVSATGILSGTPTNDDTQLYQLSFVATDKSGAAVSLPFELDVLNINDAPIIVNSLENQTVMFGEELTYQFNENAFIDVDPGDQLSYTAHLSPNSDLPAWLEFDGATRTFSGTPLQSDIGTILVLVRATDNTGAFTDNEFTIEVNGLVTSLEDHLPNSSQLVRISPNPASVELVVDATVFEGRSFDLDMRSTNGISILSGSSLTQSSVRIDVGSVKPGLYILSLTDGDLVVRKKVIVRR